MLLFELLGGDINDIQKENFADPLDEDDFNEIYSEEEEDVKNENEEENTQIHEREKGLRQDCEEAIDIRYVP